jgi:hypothetical protein
MITQGATSCFSITALEPFDLWSINVYMTIKQLIDMFLNSYMIGKTFIIIDYPILTGVGFAQILGNLGKILRLFGMADFWYGFNDPTLGIGDFMQSALN